MDVKKVLNSFSLNPSTYHKRKHWVVCKPLLNLKHGAGGIVAPVKMIQGKHGLELWTTAILHHLGPGVVNESTWVVGGDLRYYFGEAFLRVVSVLASHPLGKIVTSKHGLLTSAAMACLLKKEKAVGGLYIGAPYSDAGPEGSIGLRLITGSGSSATASQMNDIYEIYKGLTGYHYVPEIEFPLNEITSYGFKVNEHYFYVVICNAVKIYADYLESIFDFEKLSKLFKGTGDYPRLVKILVDCSGAAGGPFAVEILERRLGCPADAIINKTPTEEYAYTLMSAKTRSALVAKMRSESFDAGFCLDSVAERVMAIGMKGCAVSTGDAAALLAAHLHCVPYFQIRGIQGFARCLPLTPAIDRVAEDLDVPLYETPVGSENLFTLIDTDLISFYSDESYGIGSNHLGQKDGIWGILLWLSLFSHLKVPIYEMLVKHWKKYGKYFSLRMDYQGVQDLIGHLILAKLEQTVADPYVYGTIYGEGPRTYVLLTAENFRYKTPSGDYIDKCGVKVCFECGSRIVFRRSNTFPELFRIYVDHYTNEPEEFYIDRMSMVKYLIAIAKKLTGIENLFERPPNCQLN